MLPLPTPLLVRRHFLALAALLGVISFFKAVRFPNRWAATHFVLSYSQGFVRRGLVGELARTLLGGSAFRYGVFVVFAFALMVGTAWAFTRLAQRALAEREDAPLRAALLVFLASPALVLLVHLVGYLDYLGLLFISSFAAGSAALKRDWVAYGAAALMGIVLALVHEAQTILFMPVVLFVLACRALGAAQRSVAASGNGSGQSPGAWRTALLLAVVLAVALGASADVSLAGDAQRVVRLERWLAARVDFTTHYGVFRALKTGSPVSLIDHMMNFWSAPGRAIWWFKALLLFLPSYAFLVVGGWRALATADGASPRVVMAVRGLFLVACLSPLSLNVVAWDYARWFAIAVTNALVCWLAFRVHCRATSRATSQATSQATSPAASQASPSPADGAALLPLAASAVIALGLASDAIFFNSAAVSYYPFFDQWQALGELIRSGSIRSPAD